MAVSETFLYVHVHFSAYVLQPDSMVILLILCSLHIVLVIKGDGYFTSRLFAFHR